MSRRPAVASKRLAQLLYLPAVAIAHELSCTPNHVNVLLRQRGLIWVPASYGAQADIRFTPDHEQHAVISSFKPAAHSCRRWPEP